MRLSVIIPHFPAEKKLDDYLKECIASLVGADEVLVIVNEGIGFARAVNQGLEVCSGDYMCVLNNDTVLQKGSLKDLCNENAVVSPVVNGVKQDFWGCCFCMPRWVYGKIKGLDDGFCVGYFEDNDYIMRLKEADIEMRYNEKVQLKHLGGQTITNVFNSKKIYDKNKKRFEEKWGNK